MNIKSSVFDLENIDVKGRFGGYASVFFEVDAQKDRVLPGAFTNTLKSWQGKGSWPKMLWQHQVREPIGAWEKIVEDDVGLYVEGKLLLEVEKAREAYVLLKAGEIESLSIGYKAVKEKTHPGYRDLIEIDLLEISLVTFGANEAARVLTCKQDNLFENVKYLQECFTN